ncbi:MAG: class I fructose-bisphosphate aldolase [Patescibacteria group bacterium]
MPSLNEVAKKLVAPGKGILAADESFGTIEKRFAKIGIESTHENRRTYRELLFSTPGLDQYISGIIQFDETIRDQILKNPNIISIIKVDEGFDKETGVIKPMSGLAQRLEEYKKLGAQAAKARSVIIVGKEQYIIENAKAQAEYAKLCQDLGIVPMVEPEVLMDGGHGIEECEKTTEETLRVVFDELNSAGVAIDGIILKPNMVVSGMVSGQKATPQQIAEATVRVLKKTVPDNLPGITFLSGGQSEEEATENLQAINRIGGPWRLTFSYGRALQDSVLKTWAGKAENIPTAQAKLLERARANSEATASA